MFTPRDFSIGDHVAINVDLANREGTFGAGHVFEVIDIHWHRDGVRYDLRDHDLHLLGDVPVEYIVHVRDDA